MSDRGDDAPARGDASLDAAPEEFLKRLEPFERVLLDLKEQLYEGSWDRILSDLRARLDGQPYIYKLGQTIARDIAAIEKMRAYERLHGVNLAERLKSSK